MVINNAPATMVLQNIKTGYTIAYVGHSISTDYDILGRSFWLTDTDNVTVRRDFSDLNTYYGLVGGLKEGSKYKIQGAYFDKIIDSQLLGAQISINLSDISELTTLIKPTITKAESIGSQVDIGVGAPLLSLTTAGEADYVTIEAKKLPSGDWEKIYIGPLKPTIEIGVPIGKYRVRMSGQVAMPDGVTVESSGTREFPQDVEVKYIFNPPNKPEKLNFKAARIADGKERYDVRLEWDWEKGTGAYAREFVVWYVDQASFAANGWEKAQKINAGAAKAVTITSFPWKRLTRFKVQAVAWGPEMEATVDSVETTYILDENTVLDDSFVNETGIEINYAHIKGMLKDGNNWRQTFLLDAATGAVSIGMLDDKGKAPFNFDPMSRTLNVDGRVITNSIYAANFIMSNLTGTDNPAVYSQGKVYGGTANGLWMGMDNSDGLFKFDMGGAAQYVRWDGKNLSITGNVTIGTPNGDISLEEGITGNFQSYAYFKSNTRPPKPSDTNYPPDGWSTLPPNRMPGEIIWAIVGRINPFTYQLVSGSGWSDVGQWTGDKGDEGTSGTSIEVQWSRTQNGPWHSRYEVGDLWMRQRSGTNNWGDPIRAVGEEGTKGDYISIVFRSADTEPPTPTGTAPVPAGWSGAPPISSQPLWMSRGTVRGSTGTVAGQDWSRPVRLDGEDAQPMAVEWSVGPNGPWHANYQAGDFYMRQNVNGVWSAAIKAVGESGGDGTSGDYTNLIFAAAATKPARPTGNNPAGWSDAPPTSTNPIWMSRGTFDGSSNTLKGQWTDPVKITGDKGADGKDGTNGTNGLNAKNLTLSSTSQSFTFDGRGVIKSASSIVFTAAKQNTTATITWTARDNNNAVVTIPGGTETVKTLTSAIFGNALWVTVTVTCDGLTDSITVVRLVDGSNVFSGYLTNEAAVLIANTEGRVMDYTSGAGSMRMFYGAQDVTSQCTFSASATGLTASINASGVYSLSGMGDSTPTAFVDFTATHPQLGSIVKRMNITKSVAARGYNIVMTPTFEGGSRGTWDRSDVIDIPTPPGIPPGTSFTKAYRMVSRDSNEGNNWVNVTPGQQFRVSAWIYTKDAGAASKVGLWMLNSAGANLTWYAAVTVPAGGTAWQKVTGIITVPANAARARPWLQIDANSNFGVTLITDIRIEDMSMDGAKGSDGEPVKIEWSANGSSWHSGYSPGDIYMRQYINGVWTSAIKAVGDDGAKGNDGAKGDYSSYIYRQSATKPATPTGNTPTGWSTTPPTGTPIWMSTAVRNGTTAAVIGAWSDPIQITGQPGKDGADGKDGVDGQQGSRGAGIFTQALTWNPNGTFDVPSATSFFQANFGTGPVKYDVLTQYQNTDPKNSVTRMYNGTSWVAPALVVHGDMIVSGTIRAEKLVADELFVNRIGVGVIYDKPAWGSGNAEANYKMKIDLNAGYIHIR